MNLNHRLKRVARDLSIKYPCPICKGNGKWVSTFIQEFDPTPPDPPGCEGCGKLRHMIVQFVNEGPNPELQS